MSEKIFIIAEAGVNHNGDPDLALRMVRAAAEAGADAVKFQTFRAESLATSKAPKAEYQRLTTGQEGSQLEMLRRLELDRAAHQALVRACREQGVEFMSTPFDLESVDLLLDLGMRVFKVPSGEITNLPLLRRIGSLGRELIVSTGMADMDEVGQALRALEQAGADRKNITLLHCTTEYPAPFEDLNLRAMAAMARAFPGVRVGYSDHTQGIEAAIAAAALGARVIEKHFTLDKNMPGPDHRASLEPDELKAMVRAVRNVEKALGRDIKGPSPGEVKNKAAARKCLVAARAIARGETFSEANLAVKRAGVAGVSPMLWDQVLGRPAKQDFEPDQPIEI
ncbi:MAG: N-acetylneuraminate synthase [Desulfovibrionaceae bacterium]|nr:N-acetylneuraminate synthase [Desulfovibrionaceae bacterium]